jgi:FK506-binding protein 1
MAPKKGKKDPNAKRNRAATPIQCLVRKFLAKVKCKRVASRTWLRVFDPAFKMYFWYKKTSGESQWTCPMFVEKFTQEDIIATSLIERMARGFVGRKRARQKVFEQYTRYFDANVNKFYWVNHNTGGTFWKASAWLVKQEVPMPTEDQMLYTSYLKIKELEKLLKEKDNEIKKIRKSTYEELEPKVLEDRVRDAKDLVRSKHMDEWSVDELGAWFIEMKMEHVISFLYQNRVDGNLFVNLEDLDWKDMGITSKFHTRKLQVIMKAFRIRYEKKKNRIMEDDDLMSEYAPSELSEYLAQEDIESEYDEDEDEDDWDGDASQVQDEIVEVELTPEQQQELAMDNTNIVLETIYPGNNIDFPMTGDICRVAFTVTLIKETGNKIISSTKNAMGYPYIEVVVGVKQIIKGFDRALMRMSVGGRYRLYLTSQYSYGDNGFLPHIPPHSEIMFEVTLASFRPRPIWSKPLIQELGFSEKPYYANAVDFDDDDDF